MRTLALVLIGLSLVAPSPAAAADADRSDVEAVVRAAYVEGVHAHPDPEAMRCWRVSCPGVHCAS